MKRTLSKNKREKMQKELHEKYNYKWRIYHTCDDEGLIETYNLHKFYEKIEKFKIINYKNIREYIESYIIIRKTVRKIKIGINLIKDHDNGFTIKDITQEHIGRIFQVICYFTYNYRVVFFSKKQLGQINNIVSLLQRAIAGKFNFEPKIWYQDNFRKFDNFNYSKDIFKEMMDDFIKLYFEHDFNVNYEPLKNLEDALYLVEKFLKESRIEIKKVYKKIYSYLNEEIEILKCLGFVKMNNEMNHGKSTLNYLRSPENER